MKIAFIGTKGMNFGNTAFGGFETVVTELAPRLVREGHEVTIYCRKMMYATKSFPRQINGVNLVFLPSIETKNFGTMTNSFLGIIHALENDTDVIFFFNIGIGLFIPLVRIFKARIVTNLDGLEWERGKWSKLAKIVFKIGAKLNVKYADYLISDSEEIIVNDKNK